MLSKNNQPKYYGKTLKSAGHVSAAGALIGASLNTASITKGAAGIYTVNFTTATTTATYFVYVALVTTTAVVNPQTSNIGAAAPTTAGFTLTNQANAVNSDIGFYYEVWE